MEKKIKLKIGNPEHKELAIKYLYKDWLDYKRYIESTFDDNYKLKEEQNKEPCKVYASY